MKSQVSIARSNPIRLLNRDGTFNAVRTGVPTGGVGDFYHRLLSMSWMRFIGVLCLAYLAVNLFFAALYFVQGAEALAGLETAARRDGVSRFSECFFFSVQTFATIGYGRISPVSFSANALVTLEAFLGMLSVAIPTGLIFARFARPTARIRFSKNALISPHDGVSCLLLRMVNERLNQVVEAQVRVGLVRNERTLEGEFYRNFHDLKLERSISSAFVLSWTVVHEIDAVSPLFGVTPEMLRESDAEFIVSVTGIDDTFSQTIHARWSYTADEIIWGGRFGDMLARDPAMGKVRVNLGALDHVIEPER
jgi:inward rectifier potassium channel